MPDRIDAMVNTVQRPYTSTPLRRSLLDPQFPQLFKRDQPVLPPGNLCNSPIPIRRRASPTGRKVKSDLTFRPVGGLLVGSGGCHGATLAGAGARVVRSSCRKTHGPVSTQTRTPGIRLGDSACAAGERRTNQGQDARSPNSSAIRAPEDAALSRSAAARRAHRASEPGQRLVTSSRPCPAFLRRACRRRRRPSRAARR